MFPKYLNIIINKEGLSNRSRVSKPSGLNNDGIEAVLSADEFMEDANEITTNCAADAPVVHLKNFFFAIKNQSVVDTDLAKLHIARKRRQSVLGLMENKKHLLPRFR